MPSLTSAHTRNKAPTQEMVAEIRKLLSKDCECCGFRPTQEQLARKFGKSRSVIAKAAAGYYD